MSLGFALRLSEGTWSGPGNIGLILRLRFVGDRLDHGLMRDYTREILRVVIPDERGGRRLIHVLAGMLANCSATFIFSYGIFCGGFGNKCLCTFTGMQAPSPARAPVFVFVISTA
jgi:hypothetical protein